MFDLALTAEQEQLLASVTALFDKESTIERVRDAEPLGFSAPLWERVHAMGLTSLTLPEDDGGGGGSLLDAALVAGVAGRHLAPVPLAEATVANRLLSRLGNDDAAKLLRRCVEDGAVATLALTDTLRWVPAGAVAEIVLVASGDEVLVTDDEPPGEAVPNLAPLPLTHRSLDGARTLAQGGPALEAAHQALDEWRVLAAAGLVGAGRRALEIAVAYTTERHAFGRPIASYQSVAHRMADVATALDGAELLALEAAWAADTAHTRDTADARRHELALMAFVFGAETAESSATEALHFHGGYGYMLEYDIQLYLRWIKGVGTLPGDPARELQQLADALWGAPAAS